MSISEAMLADKLRGHTYNMTQLQYTEVMGHIDAEMSFIITSRFYEFTLNKSQYYLHNAFLLVVKTAVEVICEREKYNDIQNISVDRTFNKMLQNWYILYPKGVKDENSIIEVINNLLIYVINDIIIQIRYFRG
jgi:hypothetical protein